MCTSTVRVMFSGVQTHLELVARDRSGGAESDGERRGHSARAEAALLPAAALRRLEAHARPPPHIERANSYRMHQTINDSKTKQHYSTPKCKQLETSEILNG